LVIVRSLNTPSLASALETAASFSWGNLIGVADRHEGFVVVGLGRRAQSVDVGIQLLFVLASRNRQQQREGDDDVLGVSHGATLAQDRAGESWRWTR
jgi:hypothetical protein